MWWGLDEIFPWAGYQHQLHAVQEPADTSVAGAAANLPAATATSSEANPEGSSETGHHAGSHENVFQEVYFQPSFFLARGIGYFAIWLICGMIAARTGTSTGDARWPRRIAALAIMAVVLASTFAAFDWGMSLEPTWYSTIYGALILMSGVVAAMAVLTMSLIHVFRFPRSNGVGLSAIANDLGNLLLAFLMILAYFAFSQYLIIWSANLPSETSWYLRRSNGGWQTILLVVVAIQFVVPVLPAAVARSEATTATAGAYRRSSADRERHRERVDHRTFFQSQRRLVLVGISHGIGRYRWVVDTRLFDCRAAGAEQRKLAGTEDPMSDSFEPLTAREEKLGHQEDVVNVGRITLLGAVLAVVVVVAMYGMVVLFGELQAPPAEPLPDWAVAPYDGMAKGPQLDPDQPRQLSRLRNAHQRILSSYDWIDEQEGIARIPIDRAMQSLAEEQLPARESKSRSEK